MLVSLKIPTNYNIVAVTFSPSHFLLCSCVVRTTVRTQDPKRPGSTVVGPGYRVIVLRHRRVVDDVFRYGIIVLACVLYIGFGCKIDLEIIWTILRRPLSPAIGMGCQFILMPLVSLTFRKKMVYLLEFLANKKYIMRIR